VIVNRKPEGVWTLRNAVVDNQVDPEGGMLPYRPDPQESIRQAQTFDVVLKKYKAIGLCHACAAQAAWGHQNGFASIKPPCAQCVELLPGLPIPAGINSPWRRLQRGTSSTNRQTTRGHLYDI